MSSTPRRGPAKDTPCPHCGVLFAKNNLPMHVSAKHAEGSSKADETPGRAPRSRSDAGRATDPAPAAPPAKKSYDPLDDSTW